MKETSKMLSSEKTTTQLFANWSAVIHFLEQFSWKPIEGSVLHIRGMKSGEVAVEVSRKEEHDQSAKQVKSYGIGLHDLSW